MSGIESRRAGADLVFASFTVLFLELALIRWLPAQVRVLAYFPNIVLIAAFLGLGIGAIRARSRSLLWLWPVSLTLTAAVTVALSRVAFTSRSTSEHLWLLYYDMRDAPVVNDVRPPILVAFCLTTVIFVPLGQIVGARLYQYTRAGRPLVGYSYDLLGSLLGVIGFAVASYYRTFPVVWFVVVFAAAAWLYRGGGKALVVFALAAVAVIGLVAWYEDADLYSPYYALRTAQTEAGDGVNILANGSLHQYAAPLAESDQVDSIYDRRIREGYPIPYEALRRPPRRILILGAGTGNDVITALERTPASVDAVEIDPAILELGRRVHPNRPYQSERVRLINADARTVLRNSDELYDLVVFGTLDSMTRLSAISNVRLDNFVYTVESLQAAKERLAPDGGVVMYFSVANEEIHRKLVGIITRAFGTPPLVIKEDYDMFNEVFLAGPAFDHLRASLPALDPREVERELAQIDTPTDDWPYLYLERRALPRFYIEMMIAIVLLSALAIWLGAPEMRRAGLRGFDAEMFLFGFAFLLLETKLVTQMALVYGATWTTSAVVFGSILLMILFGTLLMRVRPTSFQFAAAGLIVSLVANASIPSHWLLAESLPLRLIISILYVGTPVFFASICFALLYAAREESNIAFGWNLIGAVFGGLVEFTSMVFGLRALALFVLAAYLPAFLIRSRRETASA